MIEPDFNAHIPGAHRADCTAADRGQALWDVMTVLAGRRALGSVHADETRGGMDEIEKLWPMIEESVSAAPRLWAALYEFKDGVVGKRRDILCYDMVKVIKLLEKHLGHAVSVQIMEGFLRRSLTEIFPLGSPERNAIDEMYGEDSQSQWKDATL
jgi:hypothetical protein